MKHIACICIACMLTLAFCPAQAGNVPQSQFGFSGWPYLQNSGCGACSLDCSLCANDASCPQCSICQWVFATARPRETAAPTAAPKPTGAPSAAPTQQPTPMPTIRPTQKPTAVPTLKPTAAPADDTGHYTPDYVTAQEQIAFNLLNQDRAANGLPALTLDSELSRLARLKSCDMNENHYFAHESPTYGNAASMLTRFGYAYNGVGENIAHHATVEKAEAAFLSSPGHRANIMGSQWKKVGIGVCIDANGFVYLTQIFVR